MHTRAHTHVEMSNGNTAAGIELILLQGLEQRPTFNFTSKNTVQLSQLFPTSGVESFMVAGADKKEVKGKDTNKLEKDGTIDSEAFECCTFCGSTKVFDGSLYEYSFVTSSTLVKSMIFPW